jgi:hypothetical protein
MVRFNHVQADNKHNIGSNHMISCKKDNYHNITNKQFNQNKMFNSLKNNQNKINNSLKNNQNKMFNSLRNNQNKMFKNLKKVDAVILYF